MVVLKELICKFLCWECVVVLKELIVNNFYFGRVCGGLEKITFFTGSTQGGCDGLERTDL